MTTTDDFLSRHDRMQRLNNRSPRVHDDFEQMSLLNIRRINHPEGDIAATCFMICLALIGIAATMTFIKKCEKEPAVMWCNSCHSRQVAMTKYFRDSGNKTPEQMAEAVLQTKSPRLMAAIAVKGEKNTPYTVRRGGYRGRHAGAWQVNEKLHKKAYGPVPSDPAGQALQAERVLTDLTQEMPIRQALNHYGGDSTDKYSRRVLAELVRVP